MSDYSHPDIMAKLTTWKFLNFLLMFSTGPLKILAGLKEEKESQLDLIFQLESPECT